MITAIHALLYSKKADDLRTFLRDVVKLPSLDAGGGWPIFKSPPAELAVHPTDDEPSHELYLMCDDVHATVAELAKHDVTITTPIADRGWGLVTRVRLPGGDEFGLYQPKHPTAYDFVTDLPIDSQFGPIDIYLFDQLLRGRITLGMRVFDAGCGSGRNLVYLFREGFDVSAADADPAAIRVVRQLARTLAPQLPDANFRTEPLDRLSFPDAFADVVISSAVLHFARDDSDFDAMLSGTWRTLAPRGLFFCRLASSIGLETRVRQIAGRRHQLPDGSERYLVDEAFLMERTRQLGGQLLDPIKTTVVQDQRSMTTWVVRKGSN